MKIAIPFVVLAGLISPAFAVQAAAAAPSDTPPAATTAAAPTGPALVARWTFDAGAVGGRVADTSGRGGPTLTARGADGGVIRFEGGANGGKYVAFPALCATTATTCARALLEAPSVAALNPGTRYFRWSASVHLTKAQLRGSANIMQKGVAGTASQWKMQIGATQGRAQCVVTGVGAATIYIARSAAPVTDGLWHKVTCQRSGTSLAVFVDGAQRGQTTIPSTLSLTNMLPLRIGGPNFNTRSDMYHGLLDDVYAELG
ncbi:LamG-like jellyroll fold domain-containing protein [Actinoplanes sp. CA-030573]|uniref:LamG-like jellyroll fold domain-containing protein n=1 Tax=Actinoplanes sp. CA-030573 TaxID=3239898 RepID=UPI003D9164D9